MKGKAIVVAGPTASGKSGLAVAIAKAFDGVVINADSMQVYDGIPILTAQPSHRGGVEHRLYGFLAPDDPCSVGRWLDLARAEAERAWGEGQVPVVVGGTGLYLRALTEGLAPVPPVPEPVRADARERLARLGNRKFHEGLAERDPVMAARLHPANSQRLVRAWEVLEATGQSLASWQALPPQGRLEGHALTLLTAPEPGELRAACEGRFLAMIEQGALDEARRMAARDLDPALPAMKALGLPELIAHVRQETDLAAAIASAQNATWRYAKRQRTWFRHQLPACHPLSAQDSERLEAEIFPIIRQFLLTLAL